MKKIFEDWNVQLAKTYKPGMLKEGTWFSITQKINGVRCTYFNGKLISRSGHEFEGFDNILFDCETLEKKLLSLSGTYFALDGELRLAPKYCLNLSDNEAFKQSVGIANTIKDYTLKDRLQFIIFDAIPITEFTRETPQALYSQRMNAMTQINNTPYIQYVPRLYSGYDISKIEESSNIAYHNGWEGIMINLDRPYEYKRSSGLLKYKKFNTIDLRIVSMTEGTGKYEDCCGALLCKYKDNIVGVGTGMVNLQRFMFWKHKEDYIGKLCEVKYKDITYDKDTGLESLQFPVFVSIKTDKTVADDEV